MKISRREAVTFLLGGLTALGGISSSSEKISLPERCKRHKQPKSQIVNADWEVLSYQFYDLDKVVREWDRAHASSVSVVRVIRKRSSDVL